MRGKITIAALLLVSTISIKAQEIGEGVKKFSNLYRHVEYLYVDEVDREKLVTDAINGMIYGLDSMEKIEYTKGFNKAYKKLKKEKKYDSLSDEYKYYTQLERYDMCLRKLSEDYKDSISEYEFVEYSIAGMLEELDPHSVYIEKKDFKEVKSQLSGKLIGVGIRFQIMKDTLMVVNPMPGGPSEKVGIQAGDLFIEIDDENIAGTGLKTEGVRERLLGEKDSKVKIKVKRQGVPELLDFEVTRDELPLYCVDAAYMVDNKIGYIKLNSFTQTTDAEIDSALVKLKAQGMKKLILDLQGNGGGYLGQAKYLADEFLTGEKMIVYTKGRNAGRQNLTCDTDGKFEQGNLVVLVDQSSASASEIVSGAIQDWDRGVVVGRRSFGKGLVQRQYPLDDGSAFRLTVSRYYTPTGRSIQKSYAAGNDAYRKEKYDRYLSGELYNQDSIKLPDSLKFKTLIKGKTVYAGGGIMPDIFVPLDTTGSSKYFSQLIRKGHLNKYALLYVNENRDLLKEKYPTFESFVENFDETPLMQGLFDYATENDLEYDEEGYNKAKEIIHLRLKASVATNLWDYRKFYNFINDVNPSFEKAVEILNNDKLYQNIIEGKLN